MQKRNTFDSDRLALGKRGRKEPINSYTRHTRRESWAHEAETNVHTKFTSKEFEFLDTNVHAFARSAPSQHTVLPARHWPQVANPAPSAFFIYLFRIESPTFVNVLEHFGRAQYGRNCRNRFDFKRLGLTAGVRNITDISSADNYPVHGGPA